MNFLGFGQSADLDVVFDNSDDRKMVEVKMDDGRKEKQLLFYDGETISGKVRISLFSLNYANTPRLHFPGVTYGTTGTHLSCYI